MAKIIVNKKPQPFRGKHRRRTVRTEQITVDTAPSRRIDKAAKTLAEVIRQRIKGENRRVKPETVARRERARKSTAKGSAPATSRRYGSGQPMAASGNRYLNDSGQLAASMQAKRSKGQFVIVGVFAKAKYMAQLHKTIDLRTAKDAPAVVKALEDGLRSSITKKPLR